MSELDTLLGYASLLEAETTARDARKGAEREALIALYGFARSRSVASVRTELAAAAPILVKPLGLNADKSAWVRIVTGKILTVLPDETEPKMLDNAWKVARQHGKDYRWMRDTALSSFTGADATAFVEHVESLVDSADKLDTLYDRERTLATQIRAVRKEIAEIRASLESSEVVD